MLSPLADNHEADLRYAAVRDDTLALFSQIMRLAHQAHAGEAGRRLTAAEERLKCGELTVLICGEFKRGKSSLLNAMLGDRLLPVDEHAATSLITTIGYGEKERIVIHRTTLSSQPEVREIGRRSLEAFVTHTGKHVQGVTQVEIEIPNERLRSGLTLVDTPGIGGIYPAHTAATVGALARADAVVFVTDAIMPLSETETRFIGLAAATAKLFDDSDALLFVMTKIDIPSSYDAIRADTTRRIADATGRPVDEVQVIGVSSLAKLNHIASRDERDLRMSNFTELDDLIWAALHRRRCKALLRGALENIDMTAAELLQPIEYEIRRCRAIEVGSVAELFDDVQAQQRDLAELETEGAAWRKDLNDKVTGLGQDALASACEEIVKVVKRAKESYLGPAEMPRSVEALNRWLTEDLCDVIGRLDRILARGAVQVQREFARREDLDLGYSTIGSLSDLPAPAIGIIAAPTRDQQGNVLRRLWSNSPRFRTGSTAGVVVGRVVGTIVAPGPGTLIGEATGGVIGALIGGVADAKAARRQMADDREAWRADVSARLDGLSVELREHIKVGVRGVSAAFIQVIAAEFDSRISQRRESLAGQKRRATEAGHRDAEYARRRLAELEAERAPILRIRARAAELANRAAHLSVTP